jgi:hypothetical protein
VSTFTSEPGTRLGGRYRLEDRVAAAAGWAAWKAIDETLARAVTVLTFAPGFPRLREVVTAARAASRLNDPRFAQVFDVEDDWDHAYIVTEWAGGDSLDDMLAPGPLDAARGARIVAEAAEAISAAHAAGLAHLCLSPDSLRWTPGGGVKIIGLGINAALSGATAEDPALADTRRLGMLLYAALTGHWPGSDCPTLPPAPVADGIPRSPRQVRAGVPAALDDITSRALLLRGADGSVPLTTPAQLSAALQAAIPPVPIPQLAPPPRPQASPYRQGAVPGRETRYSSPDAQEPTYWSQDGQRGTARQRVSQGPAGSPGPSRGRALVITILVVAVAAGLAAVAYHSLRRGGPPAPSAGGHHAGAARAAAGTPTVLIPVSAEGLEENNTDANLPIDGNSSGIPWQTHFYIGSPFFGGLQQGSGLILNMGHVIRLSSVTVTFGSIAGANVQIRIGTPAAPLPPPSNDPTTGQQATDQAFANAMTTVAQQANVAGTVTFPVTSRASGLYLLIWFTKLPPRAGHASEYQADIFNVVVKGVG